MSNRRKVLLCVAGATPAIITETLWALHQRGERVDEVRIITTLDGRDKILTGKIGGRGAADESLLDPDQGQFFKLQRDYPNLATVKFDLNSLYLLTTKTTGVPSPRDNEIERLRDIRDDADNAKAANQICEIVRELAADENVRIHASIAGGRKTMGLYLMAAMQLFGRNDDEMSHVLVSKEVESSAPKFFYKPPQAKPVLDQKGQSKMKPDGSALTTADVEIHLSTIPFIRLRGIGLNKPVSNYAEFVDGAQVELQFLEAAGDLHLNPKTRAVRVGEREVKLTLRQMFVYSLFAYFRKNGIGRNGFVGLDQITPAELELVCRLFVKVDRGESAIDAFRSTQKRADFVDRFIVRDVKATLLAERRRDYRKYGLASPGEAKVTNEEAGKLVLKSYRETLDRISETLRMAAIGMRYDLQRKGSKGAYVFGLNLAPERIRFE